MIYIRRHYKIIAEQYKPVVSNYTIDMDFEKGLDYIEEIINDLTPLIYLKEEGSRDLIEVKLIDNQVVISYVLDLFDFIEEFEN